MWTLFNRMYVLCQCKHKSNDSKQGLEMISSRSDNALKLLDCKLLAITTGSQEFVKEK
jgi:hypothetical protein